MAIENADYISELVISSPVDGDAVLEGDNELRQLKRVLQTQFPNLTTSAVINAGENPSEPAEGLGAPQNVMMWSPLAIADFVKKYWSGWGLSPPSGQSSFRATRTVSQNINSGPQKCTYAVVSWDTASYWDGTNNRYLPLEAGVYRVHAADRFSSPNDPGVYSQSTIQIRKNGAIYQQSQVPTTLENVPYSLTTSTLVEMNGTTDYVEIWMEHFFGLVTGNGVAPDACFEVHRIGDLP